MDHIHGASSAGPSTPTSDETSTAGTVRGLRDQEITTRSQYAATAQSELGTSRQKPAQIAGHTSEASGKAFATLQARAALAGVSLSCIEDDRGHEVFIASKWAMTKELLSVAEVEAFLARIGSHSGEAAGR